MRVLLLNQVFHPDLQATSQYLGSVARELARRGHDVTVICSRRDYAEPERLYPAHEIWHGVEIIRVSQTGFGHASKLRIAADFLSFLLSASFRAFLLPRAEVVVALTSPPLLSVLGAFLSLSRRTRYVQWLMDLNPDEAIAVGWLKAPSPLARFLESASRWSLKRATKIIVLDKYMRARVLAKGIPEQLIATIPLWAQDGIAFDPAGRERFRIEHGLEENFVVMYAGNHNPCHPLDTLLDAARLVRDDPRLHFCFIGGGLEWDRLRELSRSESNLTFLGYFPAPELSALLSAADLQVVVMGNALVGIVHPCKVYNFLAARRPFISIGPEDSHVADLIEEAGLAAVTLSFRHGEGPALAEELRRQADRSVPWEWPSSDISGQGESSLVLGQISDLICPPERDS